MKKENQVNTRALVELLSYIENCIDEGVFCFKFSVLHQLYEQRIKTLGMERVINRTRLKEKILEFFPQAQEQSDGKHKVLIFEQGMHEMLKQAAKNDYEGETLLLAKVAKILRKELANFKGFQFDGCFTSRCQQESVPSVLKTFVSMLLNGIDLKDNDCTDSQRVLTVSQTILFNYNTKPTSSAIKFRHSTNREPPLPLFIGLKVHTETRSKKMIMHSLKTTSVSVTKLVNTSVSNEGQLANAQLQEKE